MSASLRGQCLCGSTEFRIPVESVRFGFASCHCSICRRAHSAPVVQWLGLHAHAADSFECVGPELAEFQSTSTCIRKFCKTCGTHVYIQYSQGTDPWSGEIHVPTALLDFKDVETLEKVCPLY